jgi:hypothetical protein
VGSPDIRGIRVKWIYPRRDYPISRMSTRQHPKLTLLEMCPMRT